MTTAKRFGEYDELGTLPDQAMLLAASGGVSVRISGATIKAAASVALIPNNAAAAAANAAAINAAITAANAASVALTGTVEVLLPAGKFWISAITMKSGTTLRGAGKGATILFMPLAVFTNTTYNSYSPTSVGISCYGLLVAPFTAATSITIRDLTIQSELGNDSRVTYPIVARNVRGMRINDVEITGIHTGTMIALDSITGDSAVHHCHLHDGSSGDASAVQLTGIETDGNRVNSVNCKGLRIHDNHIESLVFGGAALPGGLNMQTDGINLGAGAAHGHLVHDNYIRNVGEGIDCFSSECVIQSNELLNCFNVGLKFVHGASRNNAFGNHIMRPGLAGIYMGGSDDAEVGDNYIHDNYIHDVNATNVWVVADRAIAAVRIDYSGQTYKPARNTVARNKVTGGASYMRYIIRQDDGTDNRYVDNEGEVWQEAYSSIPNGTATVINAKKTLVRANVGVDQVFTTAVEATVRYGTEETDTQGEYDPATYTFTSASHRRLRVFATARFPAATSGDSFQLKIRKNGSTRAYAIQIVAATNEYMMSTADTFTVIPGDTIDVRFLQTSGNNRTITGNALLSYLTIEEVAG